MGSVDDEGEVEAHAGASGGAARDDSDAAFAPTLAPDSPGDELAMAATLAAAMSAGTSAASPIGSRRGPVNPA